MEDRPENVPGVSPPEGAALSRRLHRRPPFYLLAISGVLLINLATSLIEERLIGDSLVFFSIILIGLVFRQLFSTFQCSSQVKALLFLGVLSLAGGQLLSITEEIAALDNTPVLGGASAWNGFFDTLGMVLGLVLILGSLVLAVIHLGVARDSLSEEIEVRKKTELALEAHRDELEVRVRERTAALEHAQAELLVRERQAALVEIMSTVSHELRNPLGTIRSSLHTFQLGVDTRDFSRMSRAIERCERSILRCDHIIEELQDFGHVEEVQQQMLLLDDWLHELVGTLNVPDKVQCHTEFRSGSTVPFDPERMGRALRHLLENSVDAMKDSPDRDHQILVSSMRNGANCQIRIRDTGSGMSPEELSKVGTPLFSTRAFGVGLGVPIAQETIRRHGGKICYESEADKGTTVTIELPILSS